SMLPEKDACYEVLTEETGIFVRKFDNEFPGAEYIVDVEKNIDLLSRTMDIVIEAKNVRIGESEHSIDFDNKCTLCFEIIDMVSESYGTRKWKNDSVILEAA
ncbi:MAG: hypothetical protein K2N94_05850, partial [Lachnospiraceae bacterium]|nr:hypothetical protein [Lachnospiraceae bacterium]